MKEIKLWEIYKEDNGSLSVAEYESITKTETEEMLEDVIVKQPDLLIPGLKLVGRQTETPGGPLDLLGVDEDGRLVIFELKRGTLTRDAIAQLIDYASFLSSLDPDELSLHISERSGKLGIAKIDNFASWYQEQFAKNLFEIPKPRLFLVGLGADERTKRMVNFLAESEIDISLITFHGFQDRDKVILARQVEVQAKRQASQSTNTKESNLEKLKYRISKLNVSDFYEKLSDFLQDKLSPAYRWPNQSGYSFYLPEINETGSQSNKVYLSLYLHDNKPGKVQVYFHPRTIDALGDAWENYKANLQIYSIERNSDGSCAIWIKAMEQCDSFCENSVSLLGEIIRGWQEKRKKAESQVSEEEGVNIDNEN